MLSSVASGEAMTSYALSEREAGSDARRCVPGPARMAMSGCSTGRSVGSPTAASRCGARCWPSPIRPRVPTGFRRSWCTRTTRDSSVGAKETQAGHQGLADDPVVFRGLPYSGRSDHRRAGYGFQDRAGDIGSPPDDRRAGGGHRSGRAGRRDRIHEGAQAVRQPHRRLSGRPVHAGRYGDEGGGGQADRVHRRRAGRAASRSPPTRFSCSAARATPRISRSNGSCVTPRSPRSRRAPIRSSVS